MMKLLLTALLTFTAAAFAQNQPPAGFAALFNGADLTGWRGGETFDHRKLLEMIETDRQSLVEKWTLSMREHWRVENGELINDGTGSYATTVKDYGDCELRVEYKTVPRGDSGIYLRGVPQVQIWDSTDPQKFKLGADKGSGGLWNNSPGAPGKDPLVLADKPFGEWNQLRILMVGSRVTIYLNDKLVVDHAILENFYDKKLPPEARRPILPRGPIELQTHGAEIRWRNIFLREIGGDEANRILAAHGFENFAPIFNGKDMAGWAGPIDVVKVQDSAMVWQRGKAGTIYWNSELADFVARFEFNLPPAGNNGLAIRYPGTGDTAYVGMCECQVLDDRYEKVRGPGLDPRQAHGSAYGMVAAARGYQRPIGQWNFQEVTVQGSTLRVELNGTVILDSDLSKVDPATFMAGHAHPGKDRKTGFFGFAGHNDPVEFRAVRIKKL